jgi:hypothetical protein
VSALRVVDAPVKPLTFPDLANLARLAILVT